MSSVFGELISTFMLLLMGLGFTQIDPNPTRFKIAFYWIAGIFFGNLFGSIFGSSNMNPIFLFIEFYQNQQSLNSFLMRFIGEIVGALIAVTFLLKRRSSEGKPINSYAAIASNSNKLLVCMIEILGTCSMLLLSRLISPIEPSSLRFIIISVYIGFLVYYIGPITGASFNPVRDIVPRLMYVKKENQWQDLSRSLFSSNVAPIFGGLLYMVIFYKENFL